MKTGFKDPISPKEKPKQVKSPWNYEAPCYDDRMKISAGDDYGVGFRSPVGSVGDAKKSDMIPKGRVNTLSLQRNYKGFEAE